MADNTNEIVTIHCNERRRIELIWLSCGSLSITCWSPGNARDGHGFLLSGSALLSSEEATDLLQRLHEGKPA